LVGALAAMAAAQTRNDLQDYLSSVYTAVPASDWAKLNDQAITAMFNNLTFYYYGAPINGASFPKGRVVSHQYAGTTCDCLHISLRQCIPSKSSFCPYWNLTTFLDMEWVETQSKPIPSNAWFEGLTYWGEWGFPLSCRDSSWMKSNVYGWNRHMWLYPTKGLGYWFYTGKTAAAPNKIAWLLNYGVGAVGKNKTDIMEYMATTSCPNYRNTSSCTVCSNPTVSGQCCCHGSGRNLGVQVQNYKQSYRIATWEQALSDVADMYLNGLFGEDGRHNQYWPNGTFFGYVNLLDDDIIDIMDTQSFLTAQFYREPQHSQTFNQQFANPVYSFEVLTNYPQSVYSWNKYCAQDGIAFGQLNPVANFLNFMNNGYLDGAQNVTPVAKWTPRPEFAQVFNRQGPIMTPNKLHGRW